MVVAVPSGIAAIRGAIFPELLMPSVRRITSFVLACVLLSRFKEELMAEPIAVPSSIVPISTLARFFISQP